MARTIGHTVRRYDGHKNYLAEWIDHKYGARHSVNQALRQEVRREVARRKRAA